MGDFDQLAVEGSYGWCSDDSCWHSIPICYCPGEERVLVVYCIGVDWLDVLAISLHLEVGRLRDTDHAIYYFVKHHNASIHSMLRKFSTL